MALLDIMFDIMRFGISTTAYDNAVEKKKKYRKLAEELERPIGAAEEELDSITPGFKEISDTFQINSGSARGMYKTTYDSKEQVIQEESFVLRVKMSNELALSINKRNQAINLGNHWEQVERQEEDRIRKEVEQKKAEEAAKLAAMAAAAMSVLKRH